MLTKTQFIYSGWKIGRTSTWSRALIGQPKLQWWQENFLHMCVPSFRSMPKEIEMNKMLVNLMRCACPSYKVWETMENGKWKLDEDCNFTSKNRLHRLIFFVRVHTHCPTLNMKFQVIWFRPSSDIAKNSTLTSKNQPLPLIFLSGFIIIVQHLIWNFRSFGSGPLQI